MALPSATAKAQGSQHSFTIPLQFQIWTNLFFFHYITKKMIFIIFQTLLIIFHVCAEIAKFHVIQIKEDEIGSGRLESRA